MKKIDIKAEMMQALSPEYENRVDEILEALPTDDIVLVKSTRNVARFLTYFEKQDYYKGSPVLYENIDTLHGSYNNLNTMNFSKVGSQSILPIEIQSDAVIILKTYLVKEEMGASVKKIIYIYKKEDRIF